MKCIVFIGLLFQMSVLYSFSQEEITKTKTRHQVAFPNIDSLKVDRNVLELDPMSTDYKDFDNKLFDPSYKSFDLTDFVKPKKKTFFNSSYSNFVVPALMISYGVAAHSDKSLKNLDSSTNNEISEHLSNPIPYDDYMQYAPAVAVYGLDLLGIPAKHNFRDRTLIMATSYLIMGSAVYTVKSSTKVTRPDGSGRNSFPSGHTATAFVGAHVLFKEYKDASPWIGVGGYAMASATGALRIANKKHWVSDVAVGAGVGILSTEIAYLLLPVWHNVLGIKQQKQSLVVVPAIGVDSYGAGVSYMF